MTILFPAAEDQHVLAVLTFGGRLSLIKGFDDVHPCCTVDEEPSSHKGPLSSPMMEWNNDGELLCLAGHNSSTTSPTSPVHYANVLQFYNSRGLLRFRIAVPYTQVGRLDNRCYNKILIFIPFSLKNTFKILE